MSSPAPGQIVVAAGGAGRVETYLEGPLGSGAIVLEVEKELEVFIPSIMLTRFGRELLKLSNDYPPPPDDYAERLSKFFEGRELKVRRIL